jgi:murein L,D-transpeptidase YafK
MYFERVFLRIFKSEKILEVWTSDSDIDTFKLYKTYNICKLSGVLGPKRREGDLQVPEGFYEINDFNYNSKYYLSLGLNYPNKSDRILSFYPNRGGSIYIHGDCVSVGCIAMGNDNIKEIFKICEIARSNGQKHIYVHIFPINFNNPFRVSILDDIIVNKPNVIKFENNIKEGFYMFEKNKILPLIDIDSNGQYLYL